MRSLCAILVVLIAHVTPFSYQRAFTRPMRKSKTSRTSPTFTTTTIHLSSPSPSEECLPDEYCVVDTNSGKTIQLTIVEKEKIYLDAMQSFYYSGRELLSETEFQTLKEDLQWNGSPVIAMNRAETQYLNAMQAFNRGEKIMKDEDFDKLKLQLKAENSKVAVSTEPKCYIDTGICTVTLVNDDFRTNLLYLPVTLTR